MNWILQFQKSKNNFSWICESYTPKQFNIGFKAIEETHTGGISVVRESSCRIKTETEMKYMKWSWLQRGELNLKWIENSMIVNTFYFILLFF